MLISDLAAHALADPRATGEMIECTGTGVSTAATGIGSGVSTAAQGIGTGVNYSKCGDAEVIKADGEAHAAVVTAEYAGRAQVINAMQGLSPEAQTKLIDQGVLTPPTAPSDLPAEQIATTFAGPVLGSFVSRTASRGASWTKQR